MRTLDRSLALRCKLAQERGDVITVRYEFGGGWNRATGRVHWVRLITSPRAKPLWEIMFRKQVRPKEASARVARLGR
jgi:hypothetical protein